MHIAMLDQAGIRLMVNINMQPLLNAGVFEFLTIATPLNVKGATGSPIRLLADV